MTAADTQVIHTALNRLYTDAATHGWEQDQDRNAVPGRRVRERGNGDWDMFTVVPPVADYGVAVITATTHKGAIRVTLEPPADLDSGLRLLRGFLDLNEGDEP